MELEGLLDLDQKDTMLDNNSRSIVTKDRQGEQIPPWPSPSKRTIEKAFHQLVILMEQESRGWENCVPSPFGEPSSIETHVSTPPPIGLLLLDPIQEVIYYFILFPLWTWFFFGFTSIYSWSHLVVFLAWELVFQDFKNILLFQPKQ